MSRTETEFGEERVKGKIPQRIKCQTVCATTVVLENGDVVAVQVIITEVRRLVGQKDPQGNQAYEFEMQTSFGRPDKPQTPPRQN